MMSEPTKHGKPPHMPGGGTMANISFHGTLRKCMNFSLAVAPPSGMIAPRSCSTQSSPASAMLSVFRRRICATISALVVISSSLRMTTVHTSVAAPPSVFLSKVAPPVGSERTTVKVSSFSYLSSSMISIVSDCETTPCANVSVPLWAT
jgi:hypothetical protein